MLLPSDKLTPEQKEMFLAATQQAIPGLKTQAQYNAFVAAFDALRLLVNGIFEANAEQESAGKKALATSIDLAKKVTEITSMLGEVPEDQRSEKAALFTEAPTEFQEHDIQKEMLTELQGLATLSDLNDWYGLEVNKERRAMVKSQVLRNVLMDSIRDKKNSLT